MAKLALGIFAFTFPHLYTVTKTGSVLNLAPLEDAFPTTEMRWSVYRGVGNKYKFTRTPWDTSNTNSLKALAEVG